MTTFEHVMLGVNGALAFGLHKRFGWRIVALAGIAAAAPDWDGIPMLIDMSRFETGHRVWGHNLLACVVLGVLIGSLDYGFGFTNWIVRQFKKFAPNAPSNGDHVVASVQTKLTSDSSDGEAHTHDRIGNCSTTNPKHAVWIVWVLVATIAAMTQIPADAVVSGGKGLSDWALKPFWPFSELEFVYPLVPWGNVGVTVLFAVGMIGLAKFPFRAQTISIITLGLVIGYIVVWGNF